MLAAGLSTDPDLGKHVLDCWDAFLDVVTDPATDLSRPSRLAGWSGSDVCIHLGSWDDSDPLASIVASARDGAVGQTAGMDARSVDAGNERLVLAHRGASQDEVVMALLRGREAIEEFFDGPDDSAVGHLLTRSSLGPLPVRTILHAGTYELALHALDLKPCGAPRPSDLLLDRALAALIDITGGLSARLSVVASVAAQTPDGGWRFTSSPDGWLTERVAAGPLQGTGATASVTELLDVSAGRANLAQLLLTRRLQVHDLTSFMALAPVINEVPGIPGGATLRGAIGGLGKVRRLLRL